MTNVQIGNTSPKDFGLLASRYRQQLTTEKLNALANSLGVSAKSLRRLHVGWDGNSYTFPMSDDVSKIVGIQRRFPNGRKVSVTGSRIALFVPADLSTDGILLICEGPTDTAAALDLGVSAVGRPNCNSKIKMISRFAKGREVVIVGDNDDAGKAGAEKLAAKLALCCPDVRIICPPAQIKDLRDWLRAGLTVTEWNKAISGAEPVKTTVRFRCAGTHTE